MHSGRKWELKLPSAKSEPIVDAASDEEDLIHTEILHQSRDQGPQICRLCFHFYLSYRTSTAGIFPRLCVIAHSRPALWVQIFRCVLMTTSTSVWLPDKRELTSSSARRVRSSSTSSSRQSATIPLSPPVSCSWSLQVSRYRCFTGLNPP